MTKSHESLDALQDLVVLYFVDRAKGPVKAKEIIEKTGFTAASNTLTYFRRRGFLDHDRDAATWRITAAGHTYLYEASQWETSRYRAWKEGQP